MRTVKARTDRSTTRTHTSYTEAQTSTTQANKTQTKPKPNREKMSLPVDSDKLNSLRVELRPMSLTMSKEDDDDRADAVENNEETQQADDGNNTDNDEKSSDDDSNSDSDSEEESNSESESNSDSETGEEGDEEEKGDNTKKKPAMTVENKPAMPANPDDADENPDDADEKPAKAAEPVDETRFDALIKKLSHGGDHVPKCAAWTLTGTFMDVGQSYLFFLFTMLAQSLNVNTISLEKIFDDMCATLVDTSIPLTLSYEFSKWINHKDQNDLRTNINEMCGNLVESGMKWKDQTIALLLATVDTKNGSKSFNPIKNAYDQFCKQCFHGKREMKLCARDVFFKTRHQDEKDAKRITARDNYQHPIVEDTDCCLGLLPYMPFHVPQERKPETPNTNGMTLHEKIQCLTEHEEELMLLEEEYGIVPRLLKAVFKNIERTFKIKDVFALLKRELCIIMNELDDVALEKMAQYAKLMVESFRSTKAKVKVQLPQLLLSGNKLAKGMNVNFGNFDGDKLTEEEQAYVANLKKLFTKDSKENDDDTGNSSDDEETKYFVSYADLGDLFNLSQCYLSVGSVGSNIKHATKKLNGCVLELRKVLNTDPKYAYANLCDFKAPDTPKTKKKPKNKPINKKRKGEGDSDTRKKKRKSNQQNTNKDDNKHDVFVGGKELRTTVTAP